jgi:hypothetical protein
MSVTDKEESTISQKQNEEIRVDTSSDDDEIKQLELAIKKLKLMKGKKKKELVAKLQSEISILTSESLVEQQESSPIVNLQTMRNLQNRRPTMSTSKNKLKIEALPRVPLGMHKHNSEDIRAQRPASGHLLLDEERPTIDILLEQLK